MQQLALSMVVLSGLAAMLSQPVMAQSADAQEEIDCDQALTTIEVNYCAALDLEAAEAVMAEYLQASQDRYAHDATVLQSIDTAQDTWLIYRAAHCDSVFEVWRTGTIRTLMWLECSIELTQQRTFDLWHSFLTYADSTPPLLPEPIPNEPLSDL
ncbi:MAG: lysozyme inhibitor LprI family protein [Cyanobacteria bacterium J06638_28]